MATFARKLREHPSGVPVPLLVVRLRDLERIAWREGRAAARVVERRSLRSFVETASRALRSSDLLAHDDDSEDFLAALISPTRSTGAVAAPADCRATLARLASAMQPGGGMRVETGWTMLGIAGCRYAAQRVDRKRARTGCPRTGAIRILQYGRARTAYAAHLDSRLFGNGARGRTRSGNRAPFPRDRAYGGDAAGPAR